MENLATAFVTFGLVEHMTYTQYMYRRQVGLVFRNPFTNLANSFWASLSISQSNFPPGDYEKLVAARNRIDEFFLNAAQSLLANRLTIRLKSDSILPRILRFHLRHLQSECLLDEHDLENKITRYLLQFFKLEVEKKPISEFSFKLSLCFSLTVFLLFHSL